MKFKLSVLLCLVVLSAVFAQLSRAANTRLSILRPTSTVTHQWEYMPSGEMVTQSGLKNKQYPLTMLPEENYMQSELINIEGCDLGLSVRYYVASENTHPIKIELVDENDNVIYSYLNEDSQLNEPTMTMGEVAQIGVLEGAKKARIRVSLSDAYSADEAIYIDELELYSKNGAGIESSISSSVGVNVNGHCLVVSSDKNVFVEIYTLSGSLIKNNAICVGTNRIELSSGFYFVKLGDECYKVAIP